VHEVNAELPSFRLMTRRPYEHGWVCSMQPEHLADELGHLYIGEKAAAWYQSEIARLQHAGGGVQR
jgi:glycine cleavage system H lipoate-binding protein